MISRFFIDRPVFAIVLSVVFVLAGGVAVFTLPVAQYPEVTPPTVLVTAIYPGANAQTVRNTVAAPIEEQVSGVENMMYMSSQCTNDGAYNLTVTFRLGMDTDMAQVLVQNRVSLALPVIPPLVQNEGISVKKMSPNTLMIVNLISPDGQYDSTFLSNYATIYIKDELGRLPGVAGITYLGQRDYSLRAWLDPQKLASLNLSATDVVTAISQQNLQVAAGQIGQQPVPRGQQFQLTINTLGRLIEPEQFGDIILKAGGQSNPQMPSSGGSSTGQGGQGQGGQGSEMAQGGATDQGGSNSQGSALPQAPGIVRLRDVARVELGSRQYDQSCTLDGRPSVAVSIYQLPGSNALETAGGVYAKMKELKTRFPDGLDYQIVYDTTPFIRESVDEVFKTLRDAVILVGIVVLVFLQDWKAMILPMIDVPVSLDRHVRGHGGDGLFAEQPDALRPGSGHRHRGRRRHRGAGEHRAADRDRAGLAHGHDQGHGGDHRPDPGHHPRAFLGVRAVLFPGRDHGPVLSPVRGDDRRLDDHLGRQRPDHDAVPGRADLQDGGEGPWSRAASGRRCPGGSSAWWAGSWPSGMGQSTWPGGLACLPCRAGPASRKSPAGCPGQSPPPISSPARWPAERSAG